MSNNIYETVTREIIKQIKKYKDIEVINQNVIDEIPAYPYITFYIYDDFEQTGFNPLYKNFNMRIQIKAISDNELEEKSLVSWLRRLFYLQQPTANLKAKGIGVMNLELLQSTADYVENFKIFDGGIDLTLNVNDEQSDFTQPGVLDDVQLNFKEETNGK